MENRKKLLLQYKEQKRFMGAFIIKCGTDEKAWVGTSPNIESAYNRIIFTLKQGGSTDVELQASWIKNGAENFTFEKLESLEFEENPNLRKTALNQLKEKWCHINNARPLLG